MIYLVFAVLCILFIEFFIGFRVLGHVREGSTSLKACMQTLSDSTADDDQKELAARRSSLAIGKHTAIFIAKFAAIILVLYAISQITVIAGWLTSAQYMDSIYSWPVLVVLTVFSLLYLKIRSYALRG